MAQSYDVLGVHAPFPALVEAPVCLGGGLCPDDRGVGGKSREVVLQHFPEPLSATAQRDEHEDSPEHAKAREQTAALVARDGVEYLLVCI